MREPRAVNRDFFAGPLLILIGLAAAYWGWGYGMGSVRQIGAGFMPVALGLIVAALGLIIFVNAFASAALGAPNENVGFDWPDWRGAICIVLGLAAFIILAEPGGLLIATFAVVAISALGDRANRVRDALILGIVVSVVGSAIFYFALQIRLPLLPPFLGGST